MMKQAFPLYTSRGAGNEGAMRHVLPFARAGQVIGLLGGSFDPPHAGHVHISREAIRLFGLDRLWWLVSPGNPLKAHAPAPLEDRIAAARALIEDPRIVVTDFEARAGTRYTSETLGALSQQYRGVHFVWLMGADNLTGFHLWQDWRKIMGSVPVGVLARPGQQISARLSVAARTYAGARLSARQSHLLARSTPPAWCFVNVPMTPISSSALRRARHQNSIFEPRPRPGA